MSFLPNHNLSCFMMKEVLAMQKKNCVCPMVLRSTVRSTAGGRCGARARGVSGPHTKLPRAVCALPCSTLTFSFLTSMCFNICLQLFCFFDFFCLEIFCQNIYLQFIYLKIFCINFFLLLIFSSTKILHDVFSFQNLLISKHLTAISFPPFHILFFFFVA